MYWVIIREHSKYMTEICNQNKVKRLILIAQGIMGKKVRQETKTYKK